VNCQPNNLFAATIMGKTRETITRVHVSFAVLFSVLISRHGSNPTPSHKDFKTVDGVKQRPFLNQRLLI
jgi:hypothetical protein